MNCSERETLPSALSVENVMTHVNWLMANIPRRISRMGGGGECLLVAGYIDAWEPGVTDNATANGILLEIAHRLAGRPVPPQRDIYLDFLNGHEIPEAAGST